MKALTRPSSRHPTTRPVPALLFCTLKLQERKENRSGVALWSSRGKTLSWCLQVHKMACTVSTFMRILLLVQALQRVTVKRRHPFEH